MMENRKKIFLTDSAKKRLEELHSNIDLKIESYLIDRKYVPGDDFIEITGSDIDDVENRLKIIRSTQSNSKVLLLNLYAIIGAVTFLVGLFYNDLKSILFEDKQRLIILVAGLTFSITSLILSFYINQREKNYRDLLEYEKKKRIRKDNIIKFDIEDPNETSHNSSL